MKFLELWMKRQIFSVSFAKNSTFKSYFGIMKTFLDQFLNLIFIIVPPMSLF